MNESILQRKGKELNEAYDVLKEQYPDEPYILELLYLTHIMKYAPSTVAGKMAKIRKYHKVNRIGLTEHQVRNVALGLITREQALSANARTKTTQPSLLSTLFKDTK
ncbi:MAG: hypothetical protein ACRDCE_22825 [Cetobacterium sp.]|uniref:hypothetical protein n=1 Tax=Cetobacterium sp. TaxID=2071632 RepID=UPI003EE64974